MVFETIKLISLIGFLLSWYAVHVVKKNHASKSYKALCDIQENISCSKAFLSNYSHLFFIPNYIIGLLFYPVIYLLAVLQQQHFIFYLAIVAVIASFYLAYLSFIKMKNYCLVCTTVYLINFLLFIASIPY